MALPQKPVNHSAANVRALRNMSDMSRRELVERLADYGISLQQTSLRRIEEGQQAVKIEEAQAFAKIFHIDLADFITKPVDPVEAEVQARIQHVEERLNSLVSVALTFISARHSANSLLREEGIPPAEQSASVKELAQLYEDLRETADACVTLIETAHANFRPGLYGIDDEVLERIRHSVEYNRGEG